MTALPNRPFVYAFVATLGVGAGLATLAALATLSTVLVYLGVALFLSVAFEPVLQWAERAPRRIPRWVTATSLAALLLLALAGVGTAVVPSLIEQIDTFAASVTDVVVSAPQQSWFIWLSQTFGDSLDLDSLVSGVTSFVSDPDQILALAGGVLKVGTSIIDGITGIIVVSILTLYFSLTLPAVKAKAYQLVAHSRRSRVIELTEEILQSVGRYVGGQALLALVNATFTFLLTSLLGTPAPLLLAVIAFIGALIPVVGTVIGASIAVLTTLTVSPIGALIAALALLVYMQLEAYVLTPRVMARAVAVPGALVIIAALAGAALGGVLGAFVAVPVAAAGVLIVNRVIIPARQRA